jgi:hypothetical protein
MTSFARKLSTISLILAVATASGCAGRTPDPVQVVQASDPYLSCARLGTQLTLAQDDTERLLAEKQKKKRKNMIWTAVSFVIPFVQLAVDRDDTELTELAALNTRQQHLAQVKFHKGCW